MITHIYQTNISINKSSQKTYAGYLSQKRLGQTTCYTKQQRYKYKVRQKKNEIS